MIKRNRERLGTWIFIAALLIAAALVVLRLTVFSADEWLITTILGGL